MSDGRWLAGIATAAATAAALLLASAQARADEKAFQIGGPTIGISATSTTARGQFQTSAANPNARIYNSGTVAVFVECGGSAVVAVATTSMPVAPGAVNIISCPQQYVAAITTTTATVYVTPGTGGDAQ